MASAYQLFWQFRAALLRSQVLSASVWPVLVGLLSPRLMVAVRVRRSAQRAGQIIRANT
ncbi:MAG: hypothetical protein JOZ32_19340 [Bryobacterales bacterium]|nr:hypothetical protein [Bryobacterales bacterium]